MGGLGQELERLNGVLRVKMEENGVLEARVKSGYGEN